MGLLTPRASIFGNGLSMTAPRRSPEIAVGWQRGFRVIADHLSDNPVYHPIFAVADAEMVC